MATPVLDVGLLGFFRPILTFLLVLTVLYGLFQYTKFLGDNKIIHTFLAFLIAIFAAFLSSTSSGMIEYLVSNFTILFIFIILIMLAYMTLGASHSDFAGVLKKYPGVQWTVAIIVIIIALGALSNAFGQKALGKDQEPDQEQPSTVDPETGATGSTSTNDFNTNLKNTFYHPKVIGIIFVLLIASFAVRLLSNPVGGR